MSSDHCTVDLQQTWLRSGQKTCITHLLDLFELCYW